MTVIKPRWIVFAFSVAVASSIACGGSASLSPTGPSANGSTAVITGRVNGMSGLPVSAPSNSFAPRATTSLRVTISGTDITSTVDGSGQFTLNGVPPGNVTLQFSGSGVSASITLSGVTAGEQIHVEITLTNGGGAHVDSETRHRDDNGREVEGHITAINASARTITVGSTAVNVPDTARIHRGTTTLTFADLKVGDEVEVEGAMDGTTFKATEVKIEVDEDDDNDDLPEVKGVVTGRTGDCPALTFTVGTRVVKTTSATRFDDGCATVQNNVRVEVKGTIGTDNVMTAARVELDD
jgi:hypothetical protein